MRTLPTLLLSLSILASAWVAGRAIDAARTESLRWAMVIEGFRNSTNKLVMVHIIATPGEIKKP